ncbi:MAG: DUF3108 domain-containing protein [Muribaculaceae bacterium]
MKRSLLIICLLISLAASAASPYVNETVRYRVMYKWGLIQKQAGTATLSIHLDGDRYKASLIAASDPWADGIFCVRDTLYSTILKEGFRPLRYHKAAHEGSDHKDDVVEFSYNGDNVTGQCHRQVFKEGQKTVDQRQTLHTTGITVDMLSSFYYMRMLPFPTWRSGHKHSMTIFSGKRKETLTLQYRGVEDVKVDGRTYRCFHITFIFTGDGGKKTSDDMDAWITTDASRTAVQLEGKLPVGKVRCQIIK